MKSLNFIYSFVFFLALVCSPRSAGAICTNAVCRRHDPAVRFPFRIKTLQPKTCGYGGVFDLSCNRDNATIITLPHMGPFRVQEIYYASQEIWINDPHDCLAKRILTLNLSTTPFIGVSIQSFSFFNCSTSDYLQFRPLNPIACLSDENSTVFATSSHKMVQFLSKSCRLVTTVSVPVQWPAYEQMLSSDLSDSLRLKWKVPNCGSCEAKGGLCGLKSHSNTEVVCFNTREGFRYAIAIGAGIPGLLILAGVLWLMLSGSRRRFDSNQLPIRFRSSPEDTQSNATSSGLDGPTLESYPKTVLGESKRLPKPDDTMCSICLSEYQTKETLRTIPMCQHCFHSDCIDEWLRRNAVCPICRSSPEKSPAVDDPV